MSIYTPLECFAGEDFTVSVQMQPVVDITGWTLEFTLLSSQTETDSPLATGTITVISAVAGTLTVRLLSADTEQAPGTYYYRLRRTDSGARALLADGDFLIKPPDCS